MKKVLGLLCILMLSVGTINAQADYNLIGSNTSEPVEKTESNYSPYVALGVSMVNSGDFRTESYPSVELGVMRDNVAFGVVFGRNNLEGLFDSKDNINQYFYEGKLAFYTPIGSVDGYAVLGAGSYLSRVNKDVFFEYGVGISKTFKHFSVFGQVTNWDGVTYITPGISFNL
jgi:hypothetical protein